MNFELEQQDGEIILHIPARENCSPLSLLMQDLRREVSQEQWPAIASCTSAALKLEPHEWLGILRRLDLSWEFWRQPENHASLLGGQTSPEWDLEPLTVSLRGVRYALVDDLPAPADTVLFLGSFELNSPVLLVTDPCYAKSAKWLAELQAQPGTWSGKVTKRNSGGGQRNAVLVVAHSSVDIVTVEHLQMEKTDISVGVDSGQAGFFEKARYPDDASQLKSTVNKSSWYDAVCDITLNRETGSAGIAPGGMGVVSRTFWGDGTYPCLVQKDANGLVVAAALVFDGSLEAA